MEEAIATRITRGHFDDDEREELKKMYDEGMDSTRKDKISLIQEVAKKIRRDEHEIKNWIGNERKRRKGMDKEKTKKQTKAPQKLRSPNPYNLFVKDFFKSMGMIRGDLGEKNKEAAKKWKEMSEKDKQHYQQLAAQVPCPSEGKFDKWHETQRILSNLQDNCEWAEKTGLHVSYVVCNETNHYVGGTSSGKEFLQTNPHIPASFLISTKPGITPMPPEPKNLKEMRQQVQDQLNAKYSLAIGDPLAKVPYAKIKPNDIIGLPASVHLRHPSALTHDQLKRILQNMVAIKFVGVPPEVLPSVSDHAYAKSSSTKEGSCARRSHMGYSTLSVSGGKELDLSAKVTKQDRHIDVAQKVNLLSKTKKIVGRARTMAGTLLHGHELPGDFVKVSIEKINPEIRPWDGIRNDEMETYLTAGCITAWPMKLVQNINLKTI